MSAMSNAGGGDCVISALPNRRTIPAGRSRAPRRLSGMLARAAGGGVQRYTCNQDCSDAFPLMTRPGVIRLQCRSLEAWAVPLDAADVLLPAVSDSSRMRMTHVPPEQLKAMEAESDRCATEPSDTRVDVLGCAHQALEIPGNLDVAAHDPARLPGLARALDHSDTDADAVADAVVLSACVQMPSPGAVEEAEQLLGRPVVSAAVCTAHQLLRASTLTPSPRARVIRSPAPAPGPRWRERPRPIAWEAGPCSSGSTGPSGRTASASRWGAAAGRAPAAGWGPGWGSAGRPTRRAPSAPVPVRR